MDARAQHRDGANLYQYVRGGPGVRLDPTRHASRAAEGPGSKWGRRIDGPPPILDGDAIDYEIDIIHVLPNPVPEGATQVWQVVSCITLDLFSTGRLSSDVRHIVDIVPIGGRTEIGDHLSWMRRDKGRPCFGLEHCRHTIGFDGGGQKNELSGDLVSQDDAAMLLREMRGPKATFSTTYTFFKQANCCEGIRKITDWAHLADGESLEIQGVGKWPTK